MILSKKVFFSKHQNKVILFLKLLNSRTKTTLKSSVVIFQTLETSLQLRPLQPHWPQQPLKPNFLKKVPDHDGLIINGNKITNNGDCLWNGSSQIQFFTNIRHPFWRRPLRLRVVKKISNGRSGINFHYSGSHWASVFGRFVKISGQARSLLCVKT